MNIKKWLASGAVEIPEARKFMASRLTDFQARKGTCGLDRAFKNMAVGEFEGSAMTVVHIARSYGLSTSMGLKRSAVQCIV